MSKQRIEEESGSDGMREKTLIDNRMDQLIKMTVNFCDKFLNEEYAKLSEKLIRKMARKRDIPFLSGQMKIWAAAIIYALGRINFLFDKSLDLHTSADEICTYFGTSKSTTSQKAKYIIDMFRLRYWDKDFSTERMKEDNPFAKIVFINGIPLHLDAFPEELKQIISHPSQIHIKSGEKTSTEGIDPHLRILSSEFQIDESDKHKLNWFAYEYANAIYDWLSDFIDSLAVERAPISKQNLKKFSISITKRIVPMLARNDNGEINLPNISPELLLDILPKRVPAHIIEEFTNILKSTLETQLDICQSCPTQCISDLNGKCAMFDMGPD